MDQSGNGQCLIAGALRRAMLLSVGAALILQEKTEEFLEQALERGQEAQDEGRKLVQEKRQGKESRQPTPIDPLDIRINAALERHYIPTQEEIGELEQHIVELSQRIDELPAGS